MFDSLSCSMDFTFEVCHALSLVCQYEMVAFLSASLS